MELKSWTQDAVGRFLLALVSTFPDLQGKLCCTVYMHYGAVFVYFSELEHSATFSVLEETAEKLFVKYNIRKDDWKRVFRPCGERWIPFLPFAERFTEGADLGWCYKESVLMSERDTGEALWEKLFAVPEELKEE